MSLDKLRFDSDLTNLLPEDNRDLRVLRRIQKSYPTDTGFMVLLSKSFHFAVTARGELLRHDGKHWQSDPTSQPLYTVCGSSPRNVWAAGAGGALHHYDGKSWRSVRSPTTTTLRGLYCASSTRVFAVGDSGRVLRFDGRAWQQVASPTKVRLNAVAGAGRSLFVVGDGGLILRWHDDAFVPESSPVKKDLRGVWVAEGGTAFAVGDGGTFLRRGDDGWRAIAAPTQVDLRGVSGADERYVYAVGDSGTALFFDGKALSDRSVAENTDLRAVFSRGRSKVWAAGTHCSYLRRSEPREAWFPAAFHTVDPPSSWPPPGCTPKPAGCDWQLTAVWRPDVSLDEHMPRLRALADRLRTSPLVGRVVVEKPVDFFKERGLYYLAVDELKRLYRKLSETFDRETAKATGVFVALDEDEGDSSKAPKSDLSELIESQRHRLAEQSAYYLAHDGASAGILVYPHENRSSLGNLRRLRSDISRILAEEKLPADSLLRLDIGGDGVRKLAEYDETIADILGLAWLAIGGIALMLALYFRRLVGFVFVLLPLAMSIIWTFGIVVLTIGSVNVVTGFLFAVLFGLGIDYGMQLYGRYREERQAGAELDDALETTLLDTGRATTTSALTSAAALFALMVSDFRGFSEFGLIAGVGILFALVAFLFVLPALIRLAERSGMLRVGTLEAAAARPRRPIRAARWVSIVALLLAAGGVYSAATVQIEYDHSVLRPTGRPDEVLDRCGQCLGESFTPTLMLTPSRDHLRAALDAIEISRRRLGERSTVRKTASILSLIPERQREKRLILDDLKRLLHRKRWNLVGKKTREQIRLPLLRKMAAAQPFDVADLPSPVRRSFRGPGFGDVWVGMAYYGINISDSRQARRFKDQVGNFAGTPLFSPLAVLGGGNVHVEGRRVEVACPGMTAERDTPASAATPVPSIDACKARLAGFKHDGRAAFASLIETAEAYKQGKATEGGLRGQLVGWVRGDLLPVERRLEQPVVAAGRFHVSSSELVITDVVEIMLRDGRIALLIAFIVVLLAAVADFRSWRLGLLAFAPVAIGMLWTFLALRMLDIKLNIFNFVVLPALLGIGIDYGIHFVHRYQGERSVARARGALFGVIFFCAATSVVGFGNMALAAHPGLRSLGQAAIVGLVSLFIASTYALPALITLLAPTRVSSDQPTQDKE
ncbi:MAG: MMPL family transporter [Deltaproteobacteria bacterium]|nr:MMPL family transporter [Deltaproteobacteria bacterium]